MTAIELSELVGAIAAQIPRIPIEVDLWSAKEVADYLKVGERQVTERYAALPSFPKAVRLPTPEGKRGHPRWYASEVIAWTRKWQR